MATRPQPGVSALRPRAGNDPQAAHEVWLARNRVEWEETRADPVWQAKQEKRLDRVRVDAARIHAWQSEAQPPAALHLDAEVTLPLQ